MGLFPFLCLFIPILAFCTFRSCSPGCRFCCCFGCCKLPLLFSFRFSSCNVCASCGGNRSRSFTLLLPFVFPLLIYRLGLRAFYFFFRPGFLLFVFVFPFCDNGFNRLSCFFGYLIWINLLFFVFLLPLL